MLKNNSSKQGKKLNRNELKQVTGGIKFDQDCPLSCTYQQPGGMLMDGCPSNMDCVPFLCAGPDEEYGVHCV
ncbi:hypothetical protein [Pedobacter sp. FW305-3-2-15-E-R2A2]|jgi:hypothetical protein|uniref:hypothetical protein n=1 Tax=Pedobacter sp. FW305-3-2-15-E-R2A2 TaxID=3140251 RepID=UPI0031407D2E